jgi:hypothetical protein
MYKRYPIMNNRLMSFVIYFTLIALLHFTEFIFEFWLSSLILVILNFDNENGGFWILPINLLNGSQC